MIKSPGRPVAVWLLSGCFLIFCMVIIGGITRLTGSGLSITEWKPIMGAIPPMNDHDWQIAFEKYKQIPQFQKINYDFSIEDFKSIFWWEFIHRFLGRLIGIVFILPFLFFYFKGMLDKSTTRKVLFLFLLGGLQGFIGWFMVLSGLSERTSVSHIRLAIHLITAFITFGFTLYFALEILSGKSESTSEKPIRRFIKILFGVVMTQIIYGAFVAGMHAGKIYNTYPLMDGNVLPPGMLTMDPSWINIFDNQVTVQFIHRMLALVVVLMTIYLLTKMKAINANQKSGVVFLAIAVSAQFILGILTLLSNVNITLALVHQAGAFFLFSACVYLLFHFRKLNSLDH